MSRSDLHLCAGRGCAKSYSHVLAHMSEQNPAEARSGADTQPHVQWTETRNLILAFAEQATGEQQVSIQQIHSSGRAFADQVERYPRAAIGAIGDLLDHSNIRVRVIASMFVMQLSYSASRLVPAQLVEKAHHRIFEGLRAADYGDKQDTCAFLSAVYCPRECIEPLLVLLDRGEDDLIHYAAAAALSRADIQSIQQVQQHPGSRTKRPRGGDAVGMSRIANILRDGMLERCVDAVRGFCASAYIQLFPESDEAVMRVVQVLSSVQPDFKVQILGTLELVGPRSRAVETHLERMLKDRGLPPPIRAMAAEALGVSTKGSNRAEAVLLAAVRSEDPTIVAGAVSGIESAGIQGHSVWKAYTSLLASEDEGVRVSAMRGMKSLRDMPEETAAALVERVGLETSRAACDALVAAFSAAPISSVPLLVAVMKRGSVPDQVLAALAVVEIGEPGLRELWSAYRHDGSEDLMNAVGGAFMQAGTKLRPLVPTLAEDVLDADVPEHKALAVLGIYWSRSSDPDAIGALGVAVLFAEEEIAHFAEDGLRRIGATAAPMLEELLSAVPGGNKARLNKILSEIGPHRAIEASSEPVLPSPYDPLFDRFRAFGNDKQLYLFMLVAEVWRDGGDASLGMVAAELRQRQQAGHIPPGIVAGERTIGKAVKAVRERFGQPELTTIGVGKAGGLTDYGKSFLRELQLYFRVKSKKL
jgi:hypothetical protein